MRLLRVTHQTSFRHAGPVGSSWQVLRLRPWNTDTQRCLSSELEIRPRPADLTERADFFGNTQHVFSIREPHQELSVTAVSVVRTSLAAASIEDASPALEAVVSATAAAGASGSPDVEQFRHPTLLTPALEETRVLAPTADAGAVPVLNWIEQLGAAMRAAFVFDPAATSVSTPLTNVIAQGRGVCQDFAHVFLSSARQHGLAAAYVSGYLLTEPPPGQVRVPGADAMHAWVQLHVPGTGWVDYDPTNGCFADDRYVTVARGRDYADVCPIRGFFRGGGAHTLHLGVTVEPLADECSA